VREGSQKRFGCQQGGAASAGDCGDLTVRGLIGADVARQARQHWPSAGGVLLAHRVATGRA